MEAGTAVSTSVFPRSINRKIVDHIADVNLPYSDISREYLMREGFPPDRIIKTGSPMYEVINYYLPKIQASDVLRRMELNSNGYFLVSAHREENIDSPVQFKGLVQILNGLARDYRKRVIFFHGFEPEEKSNSIIPPFRNVYV